MVTDELPTGEVFSTQDIARLFVKVQEPPYENASFIYRLLIPQGWRADPLEERPKTLPVESPIAIARFASKAGDNAYLVLQGIRLMREITAASWLRLYTMNAGYQLLGIKPLSPYFADSLIALSIEGVTFTGRFAVMIYGCDLLFLLAIVPENEYENYAEKFGTSVGYFDVKGNPARETIEQRVEYTLDNVVTFTYPQSWQAKKVNNPPPGKGAIDLLAIDKFGIAQGIIRVKTVSKSLSLPMEQHLKDTLAEFSEAGISMGTAIVDKILTVAKERFSSILLRTYEGTMSNGMRHELWLSVTEDDSHYVITTLLTPERTEDFLTWAVNQRAYEIVIETMC